MATQIVTYRLKRPEVFSPKQLPDEVWRCDIHPGDGSDHHGIGATEAEALFNAALAYRQGTERSTVPAASRFRHDPESCPSSHWNRGDDICEDCGLDLNK